MSPADGAGADPEGSIQASGLPAEEVHNQLVEALVLLLIEKGVLTRNDALSIVQTVTQVQRGTAVDDGNSAARTRAAIQMLGRMYRSFEALADHSVARHANWDNVRSLRPPIHGDRPEFPGDD